MNELGLGEVRQIKMALASGAKFNNIVRAFAGAHTRDELVEVVDAIRRTDTAEEALELAEACIWSRIDKIPLINQKPAEIVLKGCEAAGSVRWRSFRRAESSYLPWR